MARVAQLRVRPTRETPSPARARARPGAHPRRVRAPRPGARRVARSGCRARAGGAPDVGTHPGPGRGRCHAPPDVGVVRRRRGERRSPRRRLDDGASTFRRRRFSRVGHQRRAVVSSGERGASRLDRSKGHVARVCGFHARGSDRHRRARASTMATTAVRVDRVARRGRRPKGHRRRARRSRPPRLFALARVPELRRGERRARGCAHLGARVGRVGRARLPRRRRGVHRRPRRGFGAPRRPRRRHRRARQARRRV